MRVTFEFEKFEIHTDMGELFGIVMCEVELNMREPSGPDIPASLNDPGEPGYPAEFEIFHVTLTSDKIALTLDEDKFIAFFAGAQDVVNNAHEYAAEQELEYDHEFD